ncbi:MAG: AsmA-like C-terminal region-containing protein [Pseudomonadota bacterium]
MLHLARFFARHLFLSAVLLLVVLALLLTAARLLTPSLMSSYREHLAERAGEVLGQPVTIGELSAHWRGLGPELVLHDVSLLSPEQRVPMFKLSELTLDFGLGEMLATGYLVPGRITITGTGFTLIRHADGSLTVQGVEAEGAAGGDVSALLLRPARVNLRGARFTWVDLMRGRPPLVLEDVDLQIRNDDVRHQFNADFHVGSSTFELRADLRNADETLAGWAGEIYINAGRLKLPRLLGVEMPDPYRLEAGEGNLEIWGDWYEGRLQNLHGRGYLSDLRLQGAGTAVLDLDELGGHFRWKNYAHGWQLELADLAVKRRQQRWPTGRLKLSHTHAGTARETLHMQGDYFELADVASALAIRPPEAGLIRSLMQADPRGQVRDLEVTLRPRAGPLWNARARINGLTTAAAGRLPALTNFDAEVEAGHQGGRLRLDVENGALHLPGQFPEPLPLDRLKGTVHWERAGDTLRFRADSLAASSADIKTVSRLRLEIPRGGSPFVDLQTDFWDGLVTEARRYFPLHIMRPRLARWLDQALVDGHIPAGSCVLRGALEDFPFHEKRNGRFQVLFGIEDATLEYHKDWPPVEDLVAEVNIHNAGLHVRALEGQIYASALQGLNARIEHLHPVTPVLIEGSSRGPLEDILRLLRDTPLKKDSQILLKDATAAGDASLDLRLSLPLKPPRGAEYDARLSLAEASLNLPVAKIELNRLKGDLQVDNKGIIAPRLDAHLADTPVRGSISRGPKGITRVQARGKFSGKALKRQVPALEDLPLYGRSLWKLDLRIPPPRRMRHSPTLVTASSDLVGTRVDLPFTFGKPRGLPRPTSVTFSAGSRESPSVDATYGDLQIQAEPRDGGWQARLNSPNLEGEIFIPADRRVEPLRVALDQLHIALDPAVLKTLAATRADGETADPHSVPEINFTSDQVIINGKEYGQLTARSRHTPQGVTIDHFLLQSPEGRLDATASWTEGEKRQETRLQANIDAEDIGRTLSDLLLTEGVAGAAGRAEITAHWEGDPLSVSRETLNGKLFVRTREGRFREAQPGLGRILGLLNLGVLQRRLTLDFSDLFEEGFAFDQIKGRIEVEKGLATIRHLKIEAPAAEISLTGTTDLVRGELDQEATVTPAIHGALPIAGTLAGGPVVGAALLVASRIASEDIDRIAQVGYRIRGSWENPEITKLEEEKKEEAPAQDEGLPEFH